MLTVLGRSVLLYKVCLLFAGICREYLRHVHPKWHLNHPHPCRIQTSSMVEKSFVNGIFLSGSTTEVKELLSRTVGFGGGSLSQASHSVVRAYLTITLVYMKSHAREGW